MTIRVAFGQAAPQEAVERAAEQAVQRAVEQAVEQAAQQGAEQAAGRAGSQTRDQIREQVRRDVQRALQAAGVSPGEGGGRLMVPPPPPPPPPRGIGILRGPDGQPVFTTGTGVPPGVATNDFPPQLVDISIAFFVTIATIFIGTPLARAFARRMDRRGAPAAAAPVEVVSRLDRIEQAVDAIAVEVERISEGQRYVTKVMGETRALAAPNEAAANEVRIAERAVRDRVG
jgi:hypothetical protein